MEIKTKFDIGDNVWTLKKMKATAFEIRSISITQRATSDGPNVYYLGEYDAGQVTTASEQECFASKEALIAHIAESN